MEGENAYSVPEVGLLININSFFFLQGLLSQQPQREQLGCLSKPQPLCYVIDFSLSVFRKWLFT